MIISVILNRHCKYTCYYESFSFIICHMIICVCKNVNSRQLKECLAKGMSLDDISEQMGLGTGCGRCLEYACSVAEKEAPLIATDTAFA